MGASKVRSHCRIVYRLRRSFGRELGQVFPEEFPAVDDLPSPHVEEIYGKHAVFIVVAEDIGVVTLGGCHALALLHLAHGDEEVAVFGGELELLGFGRGLHAFFERMAKFRLPPFEKHLRIAHGLAVLLGGGEPFDAGSKAALDVVLQAGPWMVARQIDFAAGDEEGAVNEVDDAMSQVAGKEGSVVGAPVLAQAAGNKDLRITIGQGQLYVGVGLVVA